MATRDVARVTRHHVCPGTEDLRGLSPIGDLLDDTVDSIDLRRVGDDDPVPLVPTALARAHERWRVT